MIDHGVYIAGYENSEGQTPARPSNWDDVNHIFGQRRDSLSKTFGEKEFLDFQRTNTCAFNELPVSNAVRMVEGEVNRKCTGGGYPFNNLAPLTDGTISKAWPDRFYGSRPEQLDKQIRDELGDTIIPSTQDSRPMLPNFFLEIKSPEKSAAVAQRQACYDGALGARAMQSLQSFGKAEPVYDNNAYTIACTYYDGMLRMYTVHPTKPASAKDKPSYVMTQLGAWAMIGSPEMFRQGATWYRNAKDWARDRRDQFIKAANATLSAENSHEIPGSDSAAGTSNPSCSVADTAGKKGDGADAGE